MEADSAAVGRYKPRGLVRVMRALGASVHGLAGAFREEASSYLWACGSVTTAWSAPC